MDTRSLRFARRMGDHYRTPEYANATEKHEGPGVLMSAWFWIGACFSILCWTLLWVALT